MKLHRTAPHFGKNVQPDTECAWHEIVQGLHHRQQGIRCRHPAAVSEPHRGILVLLLPFISAGPGFTVDVAIRHIAASNKVSRH